MQTTATPGAVEVKELPHPAPPPTVGRIVHFRRTAHDTPAAAIVTKVYAPGANMVELYVVPCSCRPGGPYYATSIPHESEADTHAARWSWPPRS